MELLIGVANLVLLVVVLVFVLRGRDTEDLEERLVQENRSLKELMAHQQNSLVQMVDLLSDNMLEVQSMGQKNTEARLARLEQAMRELKEENREALESIQKEVGQKLQAGIQESFVGVTKNITLLGTSLAAQQEKQERTMAASLEQLRKENAESLDKINGTVNEKLQKTLNDRISESFETVNRRLKEVHEGLGEMKQVAAGVSDLKNVLSNVKTRGTLGEIQLESILNEILPAALFDSQVAVKPGRERVDFAVKLPGASETGHVLLPIDSKFPGDTYANLLDAFDSGNPEQVAACRSALVAEIKREAKSISDKYINPPLTTDFAILFLPFEGLYSEVVNLGLVETLQSQYKINVTGPSTMAALLNSLQMGFKTLAIQKKSGEVWKILEAAKKEFGNFEAVLQNTRKRLAQADKDLETLVGTRTNKINQSLRSVSALEGEAPLEIGE